MPVSIIYICIIIYGISISVEEQASSDLDRLNLGVSISRIHIQAPGRTPVTEGSAPRKSRYLHNTQQTKETKIHALVGIRTRDLSSLTATDLCLRPHGYRVSCVCVCVYIYTHTHTHTHTYIQHPCMYVCMYIYTYIHTYIHTYWGADKSLARSGRKQANVSVRMVWISFGALPC